MRLTTSSAVVLLAAVWAAGCGRGPSLSEIEARERATRLYTNAMADLQSGHVDTAIRGFEHVLVQDAGNYSAHFQLATLLQDIKKDYVGALAHYRAYLLYRPASDKATVAADRMRVCDTLLGAEYLRKAGGDVANKLTAEAAKIKAERDALQVEVARLKDALSAAERMVEKLKSEQAMHRRLIAKLGDEASGTKDGAAASPTTSAKEALAELRALEAEEQRRRLRPTDAELLEEDDEPAGASALKVAKALNVSFEEEERRDEANPLAKKVDPAARAEMADGPAAAAMGALFGQKKKKGADRPSVYVVQQGDTLFKISTRFYGSSKRWRDIRELNKATVPPDGRLRLGQELRLP